MSSPLREEGEEVFSYFSEVVVAERRRDNLSILGWSSRTSECFREFCLFCVDKRENLRRPRERL